VLSQVKKLSATLLNMKNSTPASSIGALIERWKAEKRELEVLLDRADEMPDDTEDSYQLEEATRAIVGARLSQLDKNLDELEQAVKDT
jgi:hypothetical protein